jgi:nicotinamidase-related amidase
MPLAVTTLDPKSALVVIDLQKGIVGRPTVHPASDIIQNASQLASAFRSKNLPVVLVNVNAGAPGRSEQQPRFGDLPPDWTELVPELNRQPSDLTVTKRTWGAFPHTNLEQLLMDRGVTQIVLCGISTSIGVESTARQAYELGLNVTIALDAITDMNPDAHLNSTTRIFPRLGETGATRDIIDLLNKTPS